MTPQNGQESSYTNKIPIEMWWPEDKVHRYNSGQNTISVFHQTVKLKEEKAHELVKF